MPTGTITPPAPGAPGPRPYRWSCTEFHDLCDAGRFDGRRVMLIDGSILEMPLPNPPHNLSLGLVDDWLRGVFATGHHVRNQMALDVGTESDPGPDLAVVVGSRRDYATRQATTAVLVVEVADSSLFLDTTTKAELYATAGVPDYWVLDLENAQLLVFRDPVTFELLSAPGWRGGGEPKARSGSSPPLHPGADGPAGLGASAYRTRLAFGPSDMVSPLAAPSASVKVADLLP